MSGSNTSVIAPDESVRTRWLIVIGLVAATAALFVVAVTSGSSEIGIRDAVRVLLGQETQGSTTQVVLARVRIPRAVTAACAGAALGAAGLQMQTLFRNPLADPFSLGLSSGASFGVAILVTGVGAGATGSFATGLSVLGRFGTVSAAALGAGAVLVVVLLLARAVRVPTTLLIVGVMLGSAVTALVSLMLTWTDPQRAQQFIAWGLGSFSGTTEKDILVLTSTTAAGLLLALLGVKPLNGLLLGENYARSLGVNTKRIRFSILAGASLLTGVVTAFCGPIGFIGIAVPHAARRIVGTSDHRVLLPATIFCGSSAALGCSIISMIPEHIIPINVITSLVGAPVVIAIILRSKAIQGVAA